MSVPVKGDIPRVWTPEVARMITERLQALERDSAARVGGVASFVPPTPTLPPSTGGGNTTTIINEFDPAMLDGYVQHHEGATPLPHEHLTGPAADLTYEITAPGKSSLLARADHTHEMSVGVERELDDLGVANDINIEDGIDVNITRLVSAWKMEEATGNRTNEVTASQYLYEIHGTVNGETGHIGDAFRPVIDTLDRDYRTYGEWLRSTAYVNWYPLGPSPDPATEQTTGVAVSGTVVVLFKPETGIVATGNHVIGGLASFNSFPYQILSVTSGWDGATYSVRGYTTLPGSVDKSTGWTACALDTWHVGFVWFDHRTETLGFQLDNNPPQLLDCGSDKIWYGTYTYWMSGPRFKGLVDSSLLFRGVLSSRQRAALYNTMLTGASDIDITYEARRNRATININPHYRTAPLPHPHTIGDIADLRYSDPQFMYAVQTYGG